MKADCRAQEEDGILHRPGAVRMQENRPSGNDDIVSEDDSTVAPPPSVDSVIRVPEAQLVDPHETEAAIARAVWEAREELTESAVRAELVVLQEETQEGQRLQQKDDAQATGEEESSFQILAFIRKHAPISCVLCSLLLLGAVGAGLGIGFSRKTPSGGGEGIGGVPSSPPTSVESSFVPTGRPTATPIEMTGVARGDRFGDSNALALSSDGSILAAGASYNDEVAYNSGRVQVFQRGNGTDQQHADEEWKPMGAALNGAAMDDLFGDSIALSANGQILAVGANESFTDRPDYVRVFEYDSASGQWNPRGSKIVGAAANDAFSSSVSLSVDGNILAVGAPENDDTGLRAGHVRVFAFAISNSEWVQEGSTLTGAALKSDSNDWDPLGVVAIVGVASSD